jgi:hypothetical protein
MAAISENISQMMGGVIYTRSPLEIKWDKHDRIVESTEASIPVSESIIADEIANPDLVKE